MSELSFQPRPGGAPLPRIVAAQAALELRLLLRNGEQLLLTVIIPTLILALFSTVAVVAMPSPRVDYLVPGVLALAVMSTAFTGQAIGTGFERRYGVLKRLGATALPRWGLLAGKTLAVAGVEALQVALLLGVGAALGWQPRGDVGQVAALLIVGTAAFSGLGLLMAGTLRAEATLAAANLVYIVLLALGGVVFPVTRFPGGLRSAVGYLPIDALSGGLRAVLRHGGEVGVHDWLVLGCWAVGALALAAGTFRWE